MTEKAWSRGVAMLCPLCGFSNKPSPGSKYGQCTCHNKKDPRKVKAAELEAAKIRAVSHDNTKQKLKEGEQMSQKEDQEYTEVKPSFSFSSPKNGNEIQVQNVEHNLLKVDGGYYLDLRITIKE